MKDRITFMVIITFLTYFKAISSFACSCMDEPTVLESVSHSDIVISGQIISKTRTKNYDSLGVILKGDTTMVERYQLEYPVWAVRVRITTIYKGLPVSDTLTILTPSSGAACGYNFQVGQTYIVYATEVDEFVSTDQIKRASFDNRTYWTHLCTQNRIWNSEEENKINAIKK
jgi:hypothetical protein